MKKRIIAIGAVVILAIGAIGAAIAAEPGTEADPLITRSYIESVVYPESHFKVVNVSAGKSLILSAGTEVILRMGNCTVIGTAKGGLSDVTMGFDLANGTSVQGNHLLICPLDDGRGLKMSTDGIVMIKGRYTIK